MSSDYNYLIKHVIEEVHEGSIKYFIRDDKFSFFYDCEQYTEVNHVLLNLEIYDEFYLTRNEPMEVAFKNNAQVFKEVNSMIKRLNKEGEHNPDDHYIDKLIIFHKNVLFELNHFLRINKGRFQEQGKSSGRPPGRSKLTIKQYNWIRDKYYHLKKTQLSSTRMEKAKLIRSQLLGKPPDWWGKSIHSVVTIMDIIKKQKWGD